MKSAFATLVLLVLGLMLAQLRAQPAAAPGAAVPTTQELTQLLSGKQYPDVIKQSQRILSIKGPAAKDIDRYDTFLIRAEAQLQLKQQGNAIESYREASKSTSDPTKQGLPNAMVTLLQKSRGFMYTPKPSKDPTHPASPLNILDDKDRKAALLALFEDEWKPKQAQIDSLKKRGNTSLAPIIQAAGIAGEMRGLEIAATGSDAQTSTALSDLTDNAAKLMTDYLDRESKRVDDIDSRANRPTDEMSTSGFTNKMGLTAPQRAELEETISNCQRLKTVGEQVAMSAGSKGAEFSTLAQRSDDLGKRADEVLNADYTSAVNINNPTNTQIQTGNRSTIPGQIPPLHPGQTGR